MALVLTFIVSFTIFTITSPYLSILIRDMGYGPALIGLFLGVFEIAGIAGPFITGWFVDRMGRFRPGLALAYLCTLVPLVPLAFVHHPAVVLICLIVLAIGVRSIAPIVDTAATIYLGPYGDYGRYRWLGSLSFVVLAIILQYQPWLPVRGTRSILIWLAATTIFSSFFLPLLPERDPRDRNAAARGAGVRDKSKSRNFVDGPFIVGLVMIALSRLAMSPINGFLSLFIMEELRWDAVSLMWALSAASEIPVMFFSAALIARFGASRLIAVSTGAIFVRLFLYALLPNAVGVTAGQLLHSLCYGLFHPAAVSFIATRVPPERRATGMAMYLSLGSGLPTFLGTSLGGLVLASFGYRIMFASFGVFAVASVVLYVFTRKALDAPTRAW